MSISLIIAAGGKSIRFRKGSPRKNRSVQVQKFGKLLSPLHGKPLIVHTLEGFNQIAEIQEVIVAAPAGLKKEISKWSRCYDAKKVRFVLGGKTRAESVFRALKGTNKNRPWIMVHDGARPFLSPEVLKRLIRWTRKKKKRGCVLASPVTDTIKQTRGTSKIVFGTIDRLTLFRAETPQLARREDLIKAYQKFPDAFQKTDEAGLLESLGIPVELLVHQTWNPKITTPDDWCLAEAHLQKENGGMAAQRIGIGYDLHRRTPRRPLYLGGVKIQSTFGAMGHSDGDVLLHAVIDAILGAAGLPDIGEIFSDRNRKWKNVRSEMMLKQVLAMISESEWKVKNVDTVVNMQTPKLKPYKGIIKRRMAKAFALPENAVSIKAKTAEGLGEIGRNEALSCQAIVMLEKFNGTR